MKFKIEFDERKGKDRAVKVDALAAEASALRAQGDKAARKEGDLRRGQAEAQASVQVHG